MARRRHSILFAAWAACATPLLAQATGQAPADPFAKAMLSSINSGAVNTTGTIGGGRIDDGEWNSITVSAAGAQSSVKTTEIVSIAPDPSTRATADADGGAMGGGNMIIGTTSTTTNNGSVQTNGSFAGSVIFGDRNSMSISATGAGTSYTIATGTHAGGSKPGSSGGN